MSDRATAVLCFLFALGIFFIDLKIPWAIGSILYVPVIILSLRIKGQKYPYILTVAVSFLAVLSFTITPPAVQFMRVLTNHGLALAILWFVAITGVRAKREYETAAYLAAIIDSSEDAIYGKSLEGIVQSWNRAAEEMYGYAAEEIIGRPMDVFVPQEKMQEVSDVFDSVKNGNRVDHYETVRKKKDGTVFHVSLSLSPIRDVCGGIVGIAVAARDITERILAQKKERELSARVESERYKLEQVLTIEEGLNTIFNVDKLTDFVVDKITKVLEAERCSIMLTDESNRELVIKGCVGLNDNDVCGAKVRIGDNVAGLVAKNGEAVLVEDIEKDSRFARPNRSSYTGKSFVCAPVILNRKLIGVINVADKTSHKDAVFKEVDLKVLCMIARQVAVAIENAKLYRELNHLAVTDPLTNLNNYRHFTKSLDYEISRIHRYAGSLCLCMIDVDDFKSYNDTFGHLQGDQLLKDIGAVFRDHLRQIDIACRYAGDEFAIILPETSIDQSRLVSQKISQKVEALTTKRKVSISMGIAQFHKNMSRYDLVLKADAALYAAKKQGKNQVQVSP